MTALPAELAAKLDALAALPEAPRGAIARLAQQHNRSVNVLRVAIYRRRWGRTGRSPVGNPTLAKLTPEQMRDYRTLTYHGFRRADALASIGITL